jgi:hypothetical protein
MRKRSDVSGQKTRRRALMELHPHVETALKEEEEGEDSNYRPTPSETTIT